MRYDNRPFRLMIEGELAGMFHTMKQAKAAKNGIRCAFEFQGRAVPAITIEDAA